MGFGQTITTNSNVNCWFWKDSFCPFCFFSSSASLLHYNNESWVMYFYSYTIHHNHFLSCKEKGNFFNPTWTDGFLPLPHHSFLRGWKIAFGSALAVSAQGRLQALSVFQRREKTLWSCWGQQSAETWLELPAECSFSRHLAFAVCFLSRSQSLPLLFLEVFQDPSAPLSAPSLHACEQESESLGVSRCLRQIQMIPGGRQHKHMDPEQLVLMDVWIQDSHFFTQLPPTGLGH